MDSVITLEHTVKPVYHCESCGYVSTIRSQFVNHTGVDFCSDCIRKYRSGQEPELTWVREKLLKN